MISSAVFVFGLLFFLIFSSGEKQPWAQADQEEEKLQLLDVDDDDYDDNDDNDNDLNIENNRQQTDKE